MGAVLTTTTWLQQSVILSFWDGLVRESCQTVYTYLSFSSLYLGFCFVSSVFRGFSSTTHDTTLDFSVSIAFVERCSGAGVSKGLSVCFPESMPVSKGWWEFKKTPCIFSWWSILAIPCVVLDLSWRSLLERFWSDQPFSGSWHHVALPFRDVESEFDLWKSTLIKSGLWTEMTILNARAPSSYKANLRICLVNNLWRSSL